MTRLPLPCLFQAKHSQNSWLKFFCLLMILLGCTLSMYAQPTVTGFSPASGPIGTQVTISGTGFNPVAASNVVYFGAAKATVVSASATTIVATVPPGTTYQPITVTSNYLTAKSRAYFRVVDTGDNDSIYSNSFQARQDLPTGSIPGSSVTADFDGDGKTDVIVANLQTTFSVFRNTSVPYNISFQQTTFNTNSNMRKIVVADINGDGKPDIVLVKHQTTANPLLIYQNTSTPGNISFTSYLPTYPNQTPITVSIEDFDGDGKPDIAGINDKTSTFTIIRNISNNGTIAFAAPQDFTLLNSAKNVRLITGKFDTDDKPDIILLTSLGISAFTNTSTSSTIQFGAEVVYSTASGATNRGIAASDLNDDGILDLGVVYRTSSKISRLGILRGYLPPNNFAFNPIEDITLAKESSNLSIEDLNLDGKPDIMTTDLVANTISVFRNNFTGSGISFDSPDEFASGLTPIAIATADFDGDGMPDMAVNYKDEAVLSIYRNIIQNAAITGISPTSGGPGTEVTITGKNFTNITGVSFGNMPAASFTVLSTTTIKAVTGEGSDGLVRLITPLNESVFNGFTFLKPSITSFSPTSGPAGTEVTITGSNFSNTAANNTVYFGAAQATITEATTNTLKVIVPTGTTWQPISVTAFKATGYSSTPFILAFGGTAAFDSASFSGRLELNSQLSSEYVAVGDFNNDGTPDLVTAGTSSSIFSVYTNSSNNGNLAFSTKLQLTSSYRPYDVAVADFNADGKLDIVVGNSPTTVGDPDRISLFLNTTSGSVVSFAPAQSIAAGLNGTRLTIADFDGDKRPDIAFANTFTSNLILLRNISSGSTASFETVTGPALPGKRPLDIIAADLDNDGKAELVISDYYDLQAAVFKNTSTTPGTITFGTATLLPLEGYSLALAVGDLDGDNLPDLVVSKLKQNARFAFNVWRNTGSQGNFAFTNISEHLLDYEAYSMAITDMNGDGKPDVLVANGTYNSRVSVFQNLSSGGITLAAAKHYSTGNEPTRILACDLNGDAKQDLITGHRLSMLYTSSGGVNILLNLMPSTPASAPDRVASPSLALLSSPNPFNSSVSVKMSEPLQNVRFSLSNINGKIIRVQQYQSLPAGSTVNLIQPDLAPGFYFLLVEAKQGRSLIKLLKQ